MGNHTSRSSAEWAQHRQRHLNEAGSSEHFDFLGLPTEVQILIAGWLCPNCAFDDGEIASTEEARAMQRGLGNLALCSSHLLKVGNSHRFHSFVVAQDPAFSRRQMWVGDPGRDGDVAIAHRYHNRAFVELLERLLNYTQLRESLKFISLRNFTLRFKAGITKRRLRLFINSSQSFNLPVPDFVPALLGLPNHRSDSPPPMLERSYWLEGELWLVENRSELNCTRFDTWLINLLLFKLTPGLERLLMDREIIGHCFDFDTPTGSLPSVVTLGIPESTGDFVFASGSLLLRMETLISSFPNLRALQNNHSVLDDYPKRVIRAPSTPPLGPNLRRLVLASEQPGRLRHVKRMLKEFPNLEEFYFYRKRAPLWGFPGSTFSNAKVFNAVHHSLRILKYTSGLLTQHPHPEDFRIDFDCFEERKNSDVPHLGAFTVLERLYVDQSLLGRMSTSSDCTASPIGPQFPDLAWKLPYTLRILTITFVYDFPTLSEQLISLAAAKRTGSRFPFLKTIFIVVVPVGTVSYTGTWPPEFSLSADHKELILSTGLLLRDVGIQLWVSTEDIGPRPVELDTYPDNAETLIAINVQLQKFHPW